MSFKRKRTNLVITIFWAGFIVSILGLVAVIVSTSFLNSVGFNIALGVLVIGFMILFLGFIFSRLEKQGIDYFVLGAIIAYLGYILIAIPSILFALNIQLFEADFWYYILMAGGLVLIAFGFLTETYELNKKFLQFIQEIGANIKAIIKKINFKLLFAPYNLLTLIGLAVIVLSIAKILPSWNDTYLYHYLAGSLLIVLNIIILFRKELYSILVKILQAFNTLIMAIFRGIKQIPIILSRVSKWIARNIKKIVQYFYKGFKYIIIRNYLLLFGVGIALFFVTKNSFVLEIRLALSSLTCIVAIVKPIVDSRETIGENISDARLFLYKQAQKPKTIFKRRIKCPHCSVMVNRGVDRCPNCNHPISRCYICNMNIDEEDSVSLCPHCNNFYHYGHLQTWLRLKDSCPICKESISEVVKIE